MAAEKKQIIDGGGKNPTGKRDPNVETQRNGKGWIQGVWVATSAGAIVFSVVRVLTTVD